MSYVSMLTYCTANLHAAVVSFMLFLKPVDQLPFCYMYLIIIDLLVDKTLVMALWLI